MVAPYRADKGAVQQNHQCFCTVEPERERERERKRDSIASVIANNIVKHYLRDRAWSFRSCSKLGRFQFIEASIVTPSSDSVESYLRLLEIVRACYNYRNVLRTRAEDFGRFRLGSLSAPCFHVLRLIMRCVLVEWRMCSHLYDEDRLARTQSDIPAMVATSSQCGSDVDRSLAAGRYSGEMMMF